MALRARIRRCPGTSRRGRSDRRRPARWSDSRAPGRPGRAAADGNTCRRGWARDGVQKAHPRTRWARGSLDRPTHPVPALRENGLRTMPRRLLANRRAHARSRARQPPPALDLKTSRSKTARSPRAKRVAPHQPPEALPPGTAAERTYQPTPRAASGLPRRSNDEPTPAADTTDRANANRPFVHQPERTAPSSEVIYARTTLRRAARPATTPATNGPPTLAEELLIAGPETSEVRLA
jgi:hypothetical protein